MAVRFDADGEDYTATVSLGAGSQLSACCWGKLSADRNSFSTFLSLGASTSDTRIIQTTTDGTTLMYWDASANQTPMASGMTVGVWYFIALAVNGANGTLYMRAAADVSWTTVSWTDGDTSVTSTTLQIGESPFGGEWLNGAVTAVKVWHGATLTQAEFEAEMWRHTPARTADLAAWYPLRDPQETTDYSGNGHTLSGGSGATQEDGPAISWVAPLRLYLCNAAPGYVPATKRGAWDDSTATVARGLGFAPSGHAATAAATETSTTNNWDVLLGRWISPPAVAAGNLSGTFGWAIGRLESSSLANLVFHLHLYVLAGDSDTVRGTLRADYTGSTEWPTAAAGGIGTAVSVTAPGVDVEVGDRIVVEIGYQAQNAVGTSFTGTINYGSTGLTDLTSGSTNVTTEPGWIEFSGADAIFTAGDYGPSLATLTGFEFGAIPNLSGGTTRKILDFKIGTPAIDSDHPRSGSYALDLTSTAAAEYARWTVGQTLTASLPRLVGGFGIYFESLPTSNSEVLVIGVTAGDLGAIEYVQSTGVLRATIGSATATGPAVTSGVWYWVDYRFDVSADPSTLDWAVDGTPQTTASKAQAATTITSDIYGWTSSETATVLYDDLVVSERAADYPLGPHKVVLLKPDTGGTTTEIGSGDSLARFTDNGATLDSTHNSANILAALSEVPPTIGATADGVHQRTSGVGNAVEIPMTSYSLQAGETISGVRILLCGWAATSTSNNMELRAWDGVTETVLYPRADPGFDASTTDPGWLCSIYPQLEGWTQARLNALTVRLGYSDDVSPVPGAHVIYAEVAIAEASGPTTHDAAANLTGTASLTATGTRDFAAASTLTATGTLTPTASIDRPADSTLTGAGSLAATGYYVHDAATPLGGAGSLSAAATVDRAGTSTLAGTGALTGAATTDQNATSSLPGVGALAAVAALDLPAASSLAGTGALAATAAVDRPATTTLTGAGALTAEGSVSGADSTAALNGAGTLTASATAEQQVAATLTGAGTLAGAATVDRAAAATLTGTGSFAGAPQLTVVTLATLSGAAALASVASVDRAGASTAASVGALTATADLIRGGTATLVGVGALTANGDVQQGVAAAVVAGSHTVSGSTLTHAVTGAALTATTTGDRQPMGVT